MAGRGTVSIIVPTHNRAGALKRALDSIGAQRYPRMEIIVIANGCTDHTERVARDFQRRVESQTRSSAHPQITFMLRVFKERLGGARARNIGMDCARGEYVAFLDDDDFWHPDALAAQVELLNRHDCALVSNCSFYLYERHGREFARPAGRAPGAAELRFADLCCENKLDGFSRCLTRRAHLGALRIDEGLEALQDWDLWLKILAATGGAARINPLRHVYGRIDNDRISNRYPQIARAQRRFLQSWRGQLDAPSIAYHEMRNRCFQIKARAQTAAGGACGHPANRKQPSSRMFSTWLSVAARWPHTAAVIFRSSERGNIKRYLHYMLLPLLDIDAVRMRLWRIGVGKKRPRKLPAVLGEA